MRMWMVPPGRLCRRHLLGEHVELHMLAGHIGRGRSLAGYVTGGLVEPARIAARHRALVREMRARGSRHGSDDLNGLAALARYPESVRAARVDAAAAWRDLAARCPACRSRLSPAAAPGPP
jgi:hypothetical protein